MCSAQPDPDFTVERSRTVRTVDGKDLPPLLLRQSQKFLDMFELVHIFTLVEQYLAVRVVDDRLLDNIRGDDVVHLLCHYHGLTEILSDGFKEILDVFTHVGGHQGFPTFLNQYHLADSPELSHLGNKGFHDNKRNHRKQDLVGGNVVQFKDYEPFVRQV